MEQLQVGILSGINFSEEITTMHVQPCLLSFSAPEDYNATSAVLTFSSTLTRACVNITLVDDEFHDNVFGSMSFWVVLESNDPVVFLRRSFISVTIRENDGKELLVRFDIIVLPLLYMCVLIA